MNAPAMNNNFWMPFSASGNFMAKPRFIASAKGMNYYDSNGKALMDTSSGLWCCNAGHCRKPIVDAIAAQAGKLDFSPTFQYAHSLVFEFSQKLATYFPESLNSMFLTNSGSEAVDSALKIALAYQRIRGKGEKQLLVGRERGYHGVGFGGISVGGIAKNRLWFANKLQTDHLPHTLDARNRFVRGQPEHGGEDFANALLRIIQLHDASTIAAVIVEPVAGSTGVLPPPTGYLEKLREICTAHDILLIFDEVITSFGRLGKKTAAEYFGVTPDLIAFAKGSTSGTAPLGGVAVRDDIRQAFLASTHADEIDIFHGYTYTGHPLSVAAGMATLQLYEDEGLMERGDELISHFEEVVHSLRDLPHVVDVRNIGFMGAIEFEPIAGAPGGKRAMNVLEECFHNEDLFLRAAGEVIAIAPPLIMQKSDLDKIAETLSRVLKRLA